MSKNENRRKYARLDIALTVSYAISGSGGQPSDFAEAVSSDLSATGLRLMTPTQLAYGTQLDLQVFLGELSDCNYADFHDCLILPLEIFSKKGFITTFHKLEVKKEV